MLKDEFEKIWTLYRTLFPASTARLNSVNTRKVWEAALEPYRMEDVASASIHWARKNKFFPDIADITGDLRPIEVPDSTPREEPGNQEGVLPYVQKLWGDLAEERRAQLHDVGLETWQEAVQRGVTWLEWLAACRAEYGEDILPLKPDARVRAEA